jgi:membrane fusion protein (multidrug efflux system)
MIKRSRKYVMVSAVSVGLLALIVLGLVFLGRGRISDKRQTLRDENSKGPLVEVAEAKPAPPVRHVTLIGETRPYFESILYAKVAGYVKVMLVDKGDIVRQGDLLAVIESPETDKAYVSALADYVNKHRIANRYRVLIRKKLISQQEADQTFSNEEMSRAYLETQKTLVGYERIIAPFTGRVTARYVDPGALIQSAQGSQSGSQAVVTVSQLDRLRVWVYVDQKDAPFVKPGTDVTIQMTAPPGPEIKSRVTRTAQALDPRTRTLLAEIDLSDPGIVAGSFVEVSVDVPEERGLQVPARALVLQGDRTLLPVVSSEGKIHYQPVKIAGNDGQTLLVTDGIQQGQRIALSIGNTIDEGDHVRVRQTEMAGQKAPIVQSQN